MKEFTVSVTLPSNTEVRVHEIKNKDYMTILKYCENIDGEGLNLFFFKSIFSDLVNLDILDKFYLLLVCRMLFVDPDISFTTDDGKQINIPIQNILTKIDHYEGEFTKIYKFDNFVLELGLPVSLFFKNVDDIYIGCIKSITLNDISVDFNNLSSDDKNDLLSKLPGSVFSILLQHINYVSQQLSDFIIIDKNEQLNIKEVNINLLSNGLISFILNIYSASLVNFFELIYTFASRLSISQESFINMTPLDSRILLNIYKKDMEEREKELQRQEEM
jgi:hypothetical protein